VRDRATLFNLLIGLNGYTVCSGIIDKKLNGKDIICQIILFDITSHYCRYFFNASIYVFPSLLIMPFLCVIYPIRMSFSSASGTAIISFPLSFLSNNSAAYRISV